MTAPLTVFTLLHLYFILLFISPNKSVCRDLDPVCGADTAIPLSQDEATEGTMSSEALPLIFEPFEDVTPDGTRVVTLMPGGAPPPAAMATGGMPLSEVDLDQLVTVETDSNGPSHSQPMLMPDWTSPWQTSGAELLEPISSSDHSDRGDVFSRFSVHASLNIWKYYKCKHKTCF